MSDEEPKIFVDEGWKARVEREKEEARKSADETESKPAEGRSESASAEKQQPLTPFASLVSMLGTQGMFSLGILAPRDAKEVMIDLEHAKFIIDALMTLRDKTKGNLTSEEQGQLTEITAQLQRVFTMRAQQIQEAELKGAGIEPGTLRQK